MKNTLAILVALSLTGASALAEETTPATEANTSTVKVSEVQKPEEAKKDQAEEITNAKLRAEAGSKSKWSMKANLSYTGGSIEKPFDKQRPNYRSGSAIETATALGGTIGLAWRPTDKLTARLGTGLSVRTPFHNKDTEVMQNHYDNDDTKILNVSTPYVELSSSFRTGNTMHMPSFTYSHSTTQYSVETLKSIGGISADHTMVWDIEGSKFQPGVSISLSYSFYKDSAQGFDVRDNSKARSDVDLGVYPTLEYTINDRYSLRTVFGYFEFAHLRNDPSENYVRNLSYQSVGLGIAVTPEVYVYPNVQFLPDNARADLTNVGLSTTMSVF